MIKQFQVTQPLLAEGIITLCGEIDEDTYRNLSWALSYLKRTRPNQPTEVRFVGDGGWNHDYARATSELIRMNNVKGVALGNISGLMPYIWMSCAERVLGDNSTVTLSPIPVGIFTTSQELESANSFLAVSLECTSNMGLNECSNLIADLSVNVSVLNPTDIDCFEITTE